MGALILVAHSLTTTAEFFMVESLYKRYHTRDVWGITALGSQAPFLQTLIFLNVLTTIGFPGTSLFAAKVLCLVHVAQLSPTLCVVLALCLLV